MTCSIRQGSASDFNEIPGVGIIVIPLHRFSSRPWSNFVVLHPINRNEIEIK